MTKKYMIGFPHTWEQLDVDGVKANVSPSAHDVPRAFHVRAEGETLSISFDYSGGRHEHPVRSGQRSKFIEAFVGKHSGRLLELRIDLRVLKAAEQYAQPERRVEQLIQVVRQSLESLPTPEHISQRVNYRMAREGLGLESGASQTPVWIVDALRALRGERLSSAP